MDTVITCIKCNNKHDAKYIQRDFRYHSNGEGFDTCVYCRGLRIPMHMTCDMCKKYVYIIKALPTTLKSKKAS